MLAHSLPARQAYTESLQPLIATAGKDKLVKIWDAASGKLQTSFSGHKARVHVLAFSPDGSRLASADDEKTIKLWEISKASKP